VSKPEPTIRTLIHDLDKNHAIAWVDGAVWPPVGTVVELADPNRDAVVIGVRIAILPNHTANVIVDVSDAPPGDFIARHPANRL
jgi:hypothetical protein